MIISRHILIRLRGIMKLLGLFVIVGLLGACAHEPSEGTTSNTNSNYTGSVYVGDSYYITPSGAGSNDGLTLDNAASIAAFNMGTPPFDDLAGDTVYFQGDFTTGLVAPCAGSAGKLVTLDLENARFVGDKANQVSITYPYIRLQNALLIQVSDTGAVPTGVYVNGEHAQIDNCTIVGQGSSATCPYSSGIRIGEGGAEFSITRNTISHTCIGVWLKGLGFPGVIGGLGMGNTIHDCDALPLSGADGIDVGTSRANPQVEDYSGLVISYNTISEWNDDGIDLYYGSNIIVEHNEVGPLSSTTEELEDGNGIKCGSTDSIGHNIIRYNYVHDINAASGNNYGITNNGADNITIVSNYVYNAHYGLNVSAASSGHIIGNNTFSAARDRGVSFGDNVTSTMFQNNICEGGSGADLVVNAGDSIKGGYNLFVRDTSHNASYYTNTQVSDMFAVDPRLSGAALLDDSPCIDAGTKFTGVSKDIRGMSRPRGSAYDIGAFERQ